MTNKYRINSIATDLPSIDGLVFLVTEQKERKIKRRLLRVEGCIGVTLKVSSFSSNLPIEDKF